MSDLPMFDGLVEVHALPPQGAITVRGDLSSATMQAVIKDIVGVALPDLRGTRFAGDRGVLWMSPDELMVLCPRAESPAMTGRLAKALEGEHALVLDVSDARAHFQLRGRVVRETIAKLAPVDMAPGHFPVGELRRTRFAQVAAGVWLLDERTAQVFCFTSVAQYMFNLLSTAADLDSEVGYFKA